MLTSLAGGGNSTFVAPVINRAGPGGLHTQIKTLSLLLGSQGLGKYIVSNVSNRQCSNNMVKPEGFNAVGCRSVCLTHISKVTAKEFLFDLECNECP